MNNLTNELPQFITPLEAEQLIKSVTAAKPGATEAAILEIVKPALNWLNDIRAEQGLLNKTVIKRTAFEKLSPQKRMDFCLKGGKITD